MLELREVMRRNFEQTLKYYEKRIDYFSESVRSKIMRIRWNYDREGYFPNLETMLDDVMTSR